jgi:long-chain acyl-CoA synthetase
MKEKAGFENCTLPDLLRRSVKQFPQQRAIVYNGKHLDYSTFDQLTDRVAAFLTAQGIAKGDRIGLYCLNCDAFPVAYFGIIKAGAVAVPVNVLLSIDELTHIFNDSGIRALIFHGQFAEAVSALRGRINALAFTLGISDETLPEADWTWSQAIGFSGEPPAPVFDPSEDIAAIIYTSGTTGRPKGAMLTHSNLAANTWSVKEALRLQVGEERLLIVLPMFHSFAGTVGVLMPLFYGCTIVVMTRFEPQQVADTIEAEKATIFLGVPTMYNIMLSLPESATKQLKSLRLCISGGAAMPVTVMQKFEERFGKAINEGDGPTECSPVTCVNPVDGVRKIGSVGFAIPLVEMKIIDAEGREQPTGEIGEICVRGPNVMKGYWNLPAATQEAFFGEWFRTGDLGHKDEEGYFFIVDRLKDMIIFNGINVYPRMVEEVLYRLPAIQEAAVIGEPHDLHGEIPVAYVALKEGQNTTEADIITFCSKHLGRHEVPHKVHFVDELPKNVTGKILKRALRVHGELERGVAL